MKLRECQSRSRSHRQFVEPLDRRQMLSSSISGNTLTIRGTDAADDIRLDVDPVYINLLRVRINGIAERFLLGDYQSIDVRAARGGDRIEIGDLSAAGHPATMIVDAGDGDDDVIGSPYADRLSGGKGDDSIRGNGGNDTLHGDDGNDTLKGDAGDDQVNGDDGNDVLSDNSGNHNLLKGNDGDDVIAFESDYLVLNGSRTANQIPSLGFGYGGAGNDDLSEYFGGDPAINFQLATLYGEAGSDRLHGQSMHGGDGNDAFSFVENHGGSTGEAWGDAGNDAFDGGAFLGSAIGHGGSGNDTLTHLRQAFGDDGDDQLRGTVSNDSLNGGSGRDVLRGDGGLDALYGDGGNDSLFGGNGSDSLYGGGGDDRLYGGRTESRHHPADGNDSADGGSGRDWVDPKHVWTAIKADRNDVKSGAKALPRLDGGLIGAVPITTPIGGLIPNLLPASASRAFTVLNTTTTFPGLFPTPPEPSTDGTAWRTVYASAAAFVGVVGARPTSAQLASIKTPAVFTAAEFRGVKAGVLHLPANWTLTPTADTDGGVVWYRVARADASFALVDAENTLTVRHSDGSITTSVAGVARSAVTRLGVRPSTLILLDSKPNEPSTSKWMSTAGWRTAAVVTKSGTAGVLPGVAQPITFGRPTSATLPSVPAGSRAIYTLGGLILIDKDGARWSA